MNPKLYAAVNAAAKVYVDGGLSTPLWDEYTWDELPEDRKDYFAEIVRPMIEAAIEASGVSEEQQS